MKISIDESFVDAAAPNAAAIKNGRGLVQKSKFIRLHQSADESIIFGECGGSGASSYHCSSDFVRPGNPTHRCSCPSRQFPCKHCLGLMYAYVQGKPFATAEVPADLAAKRTKLQSQAERKKVDQTQPRKVNKAALSKKIKAQLAGLALLETLTDDMLRLGMGNTSAKTAKQLEEQAKQLGNAFLPGAQAALHNYTKLFADVDGHFDANLTNADREAVYSEALEQLTRLHTIVRQGRNYLNQRLQDPDLQPATDSAIAAWLGHAWQLRELRDAGLVETDVELVQLAFHSHNDVARREYVDTGIWMNLSSGRIELSQTFRPYRAAKHIKSEDSFFQIAQVAELCVYPGDVNPRIRWEEMTARALSGKDYKKIRSHGSGDFAAVIKTVRNHLRAPLADRQPLFALNFDRIAGCGDELVVEDSQQQRLVFTDAGMNEEPPSCHLFRLLPRRLLRNNTLLARFNHDLDTQRLRIKPIAVVTDSAIVRLTF